jgi:hypothetical protein
MSEVTATIDAEAEPLTVEELLRNLVQDLIVDAPPADLAEEFIEEFVLKGREEMPQILAMLDAPSEQLVELLKGAVAQSYQAQVEALELRGVAYLDGLRSKLKERLSEMAGDND